MGEEAQLPSDVLTYNKKLKKLKKATRTFKFLRMFLLVKDIRNL